MDLMLQWFSQYFRRTTQDAPEVAPDDLRTHEEQLVRFLEHGSLPEVTPEQRQRQRPEPRSTSTLPLSDLMLRCAEGLSRCPQVAQALKTTPAVFTQVATQDLSLGGFVRALECLRKGAGDGVLRHAAAAEQLLLQAQGVVHRYMKRPGLTRTQLKLATQPFHEPLQLWDQARSAGAVQSPYCPPPEPAGAEQQHDQDDRRMTQLLSELFADALGAAPLPRSAAAAEPPPVEEKEQVQPRPQRAQRRQGLPIPGAAAAVMARRRQRGRKHEGPT